MQVIVRDRREGKTTELIKWLLGGNLQRPYPQWNRVLVCAHRTAVVRVVREVRRYIEEHNWDACAKSDPHLGTLCEAVHASTINEVAKNVWGMSDFEHNIRGNRPFEYAIDDLDFFLRNTFRSQPSVIAMTGESIRDPRS